MNRKEAQLWTCALIVSACSWIASPDPALRTFFATVSGFGSGVLLHFAITWIAARRRPS